MGTSFCLALGGGGELNLLLPVHTAPSPLAYASEPKEWVKILPEDQLGTLGFGPELE